MKLQLSLFLFVSILFISSQAAEKKVTGELTFYAAGDNCPPSGEIAYPGLHSTAGGLGTYANPITVAASTGWLSAGKRVYVAAYKKYFIMEDSCEECENDWDDNGKYHMDGWIGPSTIHLGTTNCEVALSLSSTQFIIDPLSTYTVDTTAFFNGTTGACLKTPDNCVDQGNVCGNTCQLPSSMSCTSAASMFLLSETRFKALNPTLDCTSNIAKGKSVCQSGSCGGP
ncbi:hypothetical protein RB653_010579 [Dictyostelium firmibasis]|uniref:Uncharacterized protein n=1 Tax=Dictyostelium firmibasis TaxID=79012 RepID=A0AAN7TSS7_9MYCE